MADYITTQSLLAVALSLSRMRQDADISGFPTDLVAACFDSSEPSILLRVALEISVKHAQTLGPSGQGTWVPLLSRMRTLADDELLRASALALTLHLTEIELLQYCASRNLSRKWKQTVEGETSTDQSKKEQNPHGSLHSEMVGRKEEIMQNLEEQNRHTAHAPICKAHTELGVLVICKECMERDPEAHLGFKQESIILHEEKTGKEEDAPRDAADEEQILKGINSVWIFCDPSFYKKVIVPLWLEKDWGERQDAERGLVIALRRPALYPNLMEKHFLERDKFVAGLLPPQHMRIIDCHQSLQEGVIVLIDWHPAMKKSAYTAISHTYGQDVYKVFDCGCATRYTGSVKARANLAKILCNGHSGLDDEEKQSRVISDMLYMCRILVEKGGVRYAWHDGLCISQYDEEDVNDAIGHIGWIYTNAEDTIIFLHYAGQPMALIGTGYGHIPLKSRWHTRAWTFQEAVLSKCRRYCVLQSTGSLGGCSDWQDFEDRLPLCYGSSMVHIVSEAEFFHSIILLHTQLRELYRKSRFFNLKKLACE
ncbi:hypothetical protein GOP47_0017073 [Adiantum capillus-veneris]|uniref:Heterokaryon incompatibility domain-containing protein n=1 Tax=Adiantum capillus-veneris TaxID=13818 RepID=A0A9D4UIW0_ADICA|nr:hypothetical protein GOP47_0017073 [Adiantum capillus-veneris]